MFSVVLMNKVQIGEGPQQLHPKLSLHSTLGMASTFRMGCKVEPKGTTSLWSVNPKLFHFLGMVPPLPLYDKSQRPL